MSNTITDGLTVLAKCIYDLYYFNQTQSLLSADCFEEQSHKTIYKLISNYYNHYNSSPNIGQLKSILAKASVTSKLFDSCNETLDNLPLKADCNADDAYYKDITIEMIKRNRTTIMLHKCVEELSSANGINPALITEMLEISLLSFDNDDYIVYGEKTQERLLKSSERVPFRIDKLNEMTNGGTPKDTVNYIFGGTNVGKTYLLCSFASDYVRDDKSVLYVTLEMSKEEIAQRIDANLLDIAMSDHRLKEADDIEHKIDAKGYKNKLVIASMLGSNCSANAIERLVKKTNRRYDVILIDYVGLMRDNKNANIKKHDLLTKITDELKELSKKTNSVIWSANQLNRDGYNSNDADLDNSSGSFGISYGADSVYIISRNENLDKEGYIRIKCAKTRFENTKGQSIDVKSDLSKMRISNSSNTSVSQNEINDDLTSLMATLSTQKDTK